MCFYYNVMPQGCRRPADKCSFAHVYLDGALEARWRAEAQGLLPPVTSTSEDGDGERPHQVAARAITAHDPSQQHPPPPPLQGASGVSLPMHPSAQQRQQHQMLLPPHSTGGRGHGYHPPPASVAPSSWHQPYVAPSPPCDVGAASMSGEDEILYDNGPTKVYIQMPRSRRTGQRVCYYHNVVRIIDRQHINNKQCIHCI